MTQMPQQPQLPREQIEANMQNLRNQQYQMFLKKRAAEQAVESLKGAQHELDQCNLALSQIEGALAAYEVSLSVMPPDVPAAPPAPPTPPAPPAAPPVDQSEID